MLKLILIGNLTADPESRYVDTANGQQAVCNFNVAINRFVKGEKKAEYFRVSCWNKQAENAAKYLSKGSKVCVIANQIAARVYTTRNGENATSLEVVAEEIEFLSSRSEVDQTGNRQQEQSVPQPTPQRGDGFMDIPEGLQEELPFQ